jgi:hypothetical protein
VRSAGVTRATTSARWWPSEGREGQGREVDGQATIGISDEGQSGALGEVAR